MSDPLAYPILRADVGGADASVVDWRRRFSYELKIYDTTFKKVAEIVGDMQKTTLMDLQFELLQIGGCGAFSFTLGEEYTKATIDYNYKVEMCFYTQEEPWFTGFITKVPKKGTDLTWTYEGFGYFQQLEFVRVSKTDLAGQEVATIVDNILVNPLVPPDPATVLNSTNILRNTAKIPTAVGYTTTGDFHWEYITARAVFEMLAELAIFHEFGVDHDRDFYFRPISMVEMERFWIGKHLDSFKSEEDESEICNKLYIRCGRLTDGTDYTLFVESAGSQATYGLREDVVDAPEIYPLFSATNLAATPTTNAGGAPAAMVDGDPSTLWTSAGAQTVGDYIQLDIGVAATYDRLALVIIDSSDPAAQEFYARDFDIRISTTGVFGGEEIVVFSGQLSNYKPQIFFTPVTGRYIRVTLTGAHANQWKVGEFEVYELDTSDIERWGANVLDDRSCIKKRASLTINGVQNLFNRRKNLGPIQPTGKIGIYDEDGKHLDDYYAKACKYSLTPKDFSLTIELGSLELGIPQQIREMLQRQKELSMSRVRTAGDLAGGVGVQPVVLTPTMIQKGAIEIPHLKGEKVSLYGGLVEMGKAVLSLGGHGFKVHDGTHYRVEAGKLDGDYGITIRDAGGNVIISLGSYADGSITAPKLNIVRHLVSGAVWSDNTPGAGQVQWAGASVTFNGITYAIANGNTNLAYIWWDFSLSTVTFQTSAVKPTLTDDDFIVAYNNVGIHELIWYCTLIDGRTIRTGSLTADEIKALTITGAEIAAATIAAGKLTIADLADIVNLLTVAAGRISIGANVLGAGLHGIKIIDNQGAPGPYTRVEIGHIAAGVANYGIRTRDVTGELTIDLGEVQDIWKMIHDEYLVANTAQWTFDTLLDGDNDNMYCIVFYGINNFAGGTTFSMRINLDGGNNYGWQTVYCTGAGAVGWTSAPGGETEWNIGTCDAADEVCQMTMFLQAKDGQLRIANALLIRQVTGVVVDVTDAVGYVWTSAGNINRFDFYSSTPLGIKAASRVTISKIPIY